MRAESTESKRRGYLLGAAIAVFAVCCLAAASWLWVSYSTSPRATVARVARATVVGDADTVSAHVDTTSVADHAVDDMLSMRNSSLVSSYMRDHPDSTPDEIRTKARGLLNEELNERVASKKSTKKMPVVGESLKAAAVGAYTVTSVQSVGSGGNTARVTAKVPFRGQKLEVQVKLVRSGGTWRVTEVENLAELMEQAGY